jgi:O-antigen/teichoic acid export membrane protein
MASNPPAGGAGTLEVEGLRRRTVRGAVASTSAQIAALVLRTGSMMALSRILVPRDFGLVAMVTAVTGFLSLFRDFGLSTASVQRTAVTEDQVSNLFWINLLVGVALACACAALAPALVRFYGETRLLKITLVLAAGFILNGAGVQHRALLQRRMQFPAIAAIDITSLVLSITLAITMALTGFGYWAIVVTTVLPQMIGSIGVWIAARWIPGRPTRRSGLGPLLKFGGTLTLNSLVVQAAYNCDKILLGRFWGAEALGIYSRAYQLINLPVDGLNSAISQVALPALARVQNDADRLRRNFLQGYGVFLAIMIPLTVACGLFSEDIVRVFLGARFAESAPVFRRLVPTMFVLAIINPLAWLMLATGRTVRSLLIALMIAPTVIAGYSIGLHAGPQGVALGFSGAMLLLVTPVVLWARHGTKLSGGDVVREARPAVISAAAGGLAAFAAMPYTRALEPTILRLTVDSAILFGVFAIVMFFTLRDRGVYWKILSDAKLVPAAKARV